MFVMSSAKNNQQYKNHTMAAQTLKHLQEPSLSVQKGLQEYKKEIKRLTAISWQIIYTALWNTHNFSQQEIETAKDFITAFLEQGTNHKKNYAEIVQRALLAKQYINSHPGTYIPLPSQWFNMDNKNGFTGTLKWFNALQKTRQSLPVYKQPLKAFPEAILETVQSGTAKDFHYWRSYFAQSNAQNLLNLFLSTIANQANSQ
jgi:hypothetical protein